MQQDLSAETPDNPIRIIGINEAGQEDGNGFLITAHVTLPWLQDTATDQVWAAWQAVWRDVVVMDATGHRRAVYNLTTHDLGDSANYQHLKDLLHDARTPLP